MFYKKIWEVIGNEREGNVGKFYRKSGNKGKSCYKIYQRVLPWFLSDMVLIWGLTYIIKKFNWLFIHKVMSSNYYGTQALGNNH